MKNDHFKNLSYQQIKILIEVLFETQIKELDYIKSQFERNSINFENTSSFLIEINLIKIQNNKFKILNDLFLNSKIEDDALKRIIVNQLFKTKKLSKLLRSYFENYELDNENYSYSPNTSQRVKESGIRNLFIELGVVKYLMQHDLYKITDEYLDALNIFFENVKVSPEELKSIQSKKDELGISAELCIIDYEKSKLGSNHELLNKIIHVALEDVTVGYDIISWTKDKNAKQMFIEVKAVSIHDRRFYLSKNEFSKAKKFGDKYFLYLLPVIKHNVFDIDNLEIIQNPINTLLSESSSWEMGTEKYFFVKSES